MERRQFLKLAGAASVAAVAGRFIGSSGADAVAAPTAFAGRSYRGTRDGRILVSEDGKTWSLHTTFGHDYSVKHLDVVQDRVTAHLGFGHRSFQVRLASDDRSWVTVA